MSLYDYRWCQEKLLAMDRDPPFYGLLFALALRADSTNFAKLRAMWPEEIAELQQRYDAPGGVLPGDLPEGGAK